MDFNPIYNGIPQNEERQQNEVHYSEALIERYSYVKPKIPQIIEATNNVISQNKMQKILINPNFSKKVFVNPNFKLESRLPETTTKSVIHVNTKIYNPKFLQTNCNNDLAKYEKLPSPINHAQKIHVNPNAIFKNAQYLNDLLQKRLLDTETSTSKVISRPQNISKISRYSLVRSRDLPLTNIDKPKYKIVKGMPINKNIRYKHKLVKSPCVVSGAIRKRRNSVKSLYKIVKSSTYSNTKKINARGKLLKSKEKNCLKNKYKIDNRNNLYESGLCPDPSNSTTSIKINKKKFVYVNKFLSIGEVAKHAIIKKNPNLQMSITNIKIGGVPYKKSAHSLKRTLSSECKVGKFKVGVKDMTKSHQYKLVRKNSATKIENEKVEKALLIKKTRRLSERSFTVQKFKIVRKEKRPHSPKKLKKCNMPCPFYRRTGICIANENGKCLRKHDPDQIALCTKFLQGACIKENCKLSHKVLPEKMPTCKYYLEGSCAKDNCQYLHVKISPKAEICRDFIEGFCAKAAKCDKRHQYLCPDYEKYGKCPKQRCAYPHGKMVRHYYLENKNKFVKNHLINQKVTKKNAERNLEVVKETLETEVSKETKPRYYEEKESLQPELNSEIDAQKTVKDFRSRPKLGELPAFIPFS